jgi:hypothetical protein
MHRNMHVRVRVAALDLDAAKLYLRAVEAMAGEGARSNKPAVIMLALRLLERQAPRARAMAERIT